MNHDSLVAYIVIASIVSILIGVGIGLYICGTTSHARDNNDEYFRGRMEQEILDSYGNNNPYKSMVPQYNDRNRDEFKRPC